MPDSRPNILLVMADQMSALSMALHGGVARTPHLAALADAGVVFENAYCNYPLCAPARFAMMTGRLPSRIGAYDNAAELPASSPTFAHYLRAVGYYTCLSGKMHFVGPDQLHGYEDRLTTEIYPADFGWTPRASYGEAVAEAALDQPEPGVSGVETVADAAPLARTMQMDYDEEVAHQAIRRIYDYARAGEDRPLFLTVSFTQPHDPYVITQEYWDRHGAAEIDGPRTPAIALEDLDQHSRGLHQHYGLHRFQVDDAMLRRARRGYYGMISYIDDKLALLQGALDAAGLSDNTVIIFTSDHGDMMGERGMWFKKTLYDQAIRVPMVVHWPGALKPARIAQPVSLVDLLPTLLDIAGHDPAALVAPIDGESLLPFATGASPDDRPVLVEHIDGATDAPRVMVRRGTWKYVYSEAYPAQLFDLAEDPEQLENRAGDPACAALEAGLRAIVAREWDLPTLRAAVIADQRKRRFLAETLATGRVESWDYQPIVDATRNFVRHGDLFPEVERRGYLQYPNAGPNAGRSQP
jgi:choline-sulfatase